MSRRNLFLLLCLTIWSATAFAVTIDTSTYFAYLRVMPTSSLEATHYVLLSNKPCGAKGVGKSWKKATYLYPNTIGEQGACWTEFTDNKALIDICMTGRNEYSNELGNSCLPASKSLFIDTGSLPKRADF